MTTTFKFAGIVGTGAMGRGIAQMAAQAGSRVCLFDNQPQASAKAIASIFAQWDRLCEKGRLSAEQSADLKSRMSCAETIDDLPPLFREVAADDRLGDRPDPDFFYYCVSVICTIIQFADAELLCP